MADVIEPLRRARLVRRACERGPYLFHDLAGTADAAEQRPSTPAGAAPAWYRPLPIRDTITDASLRSLTAGGAHALNALPSNM